MIGTISPKRGQCHLKLLIDASAKREDSSKKGCDNYSISVSPFIY